MDWTWHLPGLFLLLLLEEIGFPMPLVTSSIVVALGLQLREGALPLWSILLTTGAASLTGSTALYAAGRLGARPLLLRYGGILRLPTERLVRLESRLTHGAFLAILGARFAPGLTQVASLLAGVLRLPLPALLAAVLTASTGWTLFWLSGGYLGYSALSPMLGFLPAQAQLPVAALSLALLMMAAVRALRGLSGKARGDSRGGPRRGGDDTTSS